MTETTSLLDTPIATLGHTDGDMKIVKTIKKQVTTMAVNLRPYFIPLAKRVDFWDGERMTSEDCYFVSAPKRDAEIVAPSDRHTPNKNCVATVLYASNSDPGLRLATIRCTENCTPNQATVLDSILMMGGMFGSLDYFPAIFKDTTISAADLLNGMKALAAACREYDQRVQQANKELKSIVGDVQSFSLRIASN